MTGKHISALILAAGSSSRMGQPKQALLVDGEPLIVRTVRAALASKADTVLAVLGSGASNHKQVLNDLPVSILIHERWQEGLGSTLKRGLNEILRLNSQTNAVLVMVCDQPELTTEHLNQLIDQYKSTHHAIVASSYQGAIGVPAIVDSSLFSDLLRIENHEGAKAVIRNYPQLTLAIPFPGGEIDLDTLEQYTRYLREKNN